MLEFSAVREINREILYVCLTAHGARNFSGELIFTHCGEVIIWKRSEVHRDQEAAADNLEWVKAIDDHWKDFLVFMDRQNAEIEVSFRLGKVTRTLVRSV